MTVYFQVSVLVMLSRRFSSVVGSPYLRQRHVTFMTRNGLNGICIAACEQVPTSHLLYLDVGLPAGFRAAPF